MSRHIHQWTYVTAFIRKCWICWCKQVKAKSGVWSVVPPDDPVQPKAKRPK